MTSATPSPGSGVRVGIDLGTTHSLVAVLSGTRAFALPNALGDILTPSAVSITEDGTVLVGAAARARAATHPERTAFAFKRDMGTDRVLKLGDRDFRPEELSALVLAELKRDAEKALGEPIIDAVVTVPAYFGEAQRRATRIACEIAGLPVERIINEPTAAAIAYGLHERHREFRAAVLDLGGGTFDVTVLEVMEGVIEIRSSSGDLRLGGDDFTEALATRIAEKVRLEHGSPPMSNPVTTARVREAADGAKRRLSGEGTTLVPLVNLALANETSVSIEVTLTREDAVLAWAPLLERLKAPIVRALRDASLAPAKIDEVLLVGGATRMPCVQELAAQLFGRLPLRTLPPDEAIAFGAAVQAALKGGLAAVDDMVVTDIAPFSLGVETSMRTETRMIDGLFAPILERGTVLPASRVETFHTLADGQSSIRLRIYQGEHSLCRDNVKIGEYLVEGLPRGPAGSQSIEVRFTYDLNGILDVEITVCSTGKRSDFVIERGGTKLTDEQIAAARKKLQALKFHPREALPNVTALARADALYVELSGKNREVLGMAIAHFRGALESQHSETIRVAREHLLSCVTSLS